MNDAITIPRDAVELMIPETVAGLPTFANLIGRYDAYAMFDAFEIKSIRQAIMRITQTLTFPIKHITPMGKRSDAIQTVITIDSSRIFFRYTKSINVFPTSPAIRGNAFKKLATDAEIAW